MVRLCVLRTTVLSKSIGTGEAESLVFVRDVQKTFEIKR